MGNQASSAGSYAPPSPRGAPSQPPQTKRRVPVHAAVAPLRGAGPRGIAVGVQEFVVGSYLPPELRSPPAPYPPQMIMRASSHTAICPSRASGAPVELVIDQVSAAGSY